MNGINIVYTCIEHNRLSQCNIKILNLESVHFNIPWDVTTC